MREGTVARFSVSANRALLAQFDQMRAEKGYANRSLALTDLMRAGLAGYRQEVEDEEAAGTVTLVYDHHEPRVQRALTALQHDFGAAIISTLHVHLDHHHCLEVIVVRGRSSEIRALANRLIAAKGVKHGKFTLTSTGQNLPA